jgi:hypothetical protein
VELVLDPVEARHDTGTPRDSRPVWDALPVIPELIGAVEFDRPGSTRPLHELPLYQRPDLIFPGHPHHHRQYSPGAFPVAEHVHRHTLKLPVWHREQDLALAEQYARAAIKVSDHHEELL